MRRRRQEKVEAFPNHGLDVGDASIQVLLMAAEAGIHFMPY